MKRRFVVKRNLFANLNVALGNEKNVVVDDSHKRVWLARVVDVVRPVAAATAVQTPLRVDRTDAQFGASQSSCRSFSVGDALARVLSDFVVFEEHATRKTSFAIDRR